MISGEIILIGVVLIGLIMFASCGINNEKKD